jgi:hypothetical protein
LFGVAWPVSVVPHQRPAELGKAADALHGLIELAEMTGRSGRAGKTDLN